MNFRFKVLYYLRPFEVSGRLVSTILEMAYQIRFFLMILALVMMGFAQSFWILSSVDINIAYGTVRQALLNTYYLMLVNLPSNDDVDASHNSTMLYTLIVVFTLTVTILMLNLLIALMSDAYGKIRDNGLAQWRFEQATIILEENRSAPVGRYKPYVHVLRQAQYDNDDVIQKREAIEMEEIMKRVQRIEETIDIMSHSGKEHSLKLSRIGAPSNQTTVDRNHDPKHSGKPVVTVEDRGVI